MGSAGVAMSIDRDFLPLDDDLDMFHPVTVGGWVRCHHHQRERLEALMRKRGWSYPQLLIICAKHLKKSEGLADTGRLSFEEAERLLEEL